LSPRQQGELLRVVNQLTSEGRLNAADISSVAAMHRAPPAVSSYDPVRNYFSTRFGSQSLALGAANQATADTWRIPTAGVSHSSVMVVGVTMVVAPEVTTTVAGLVLLGAALLIGMGHQIKDITEDAISVFPMSHSDDEKAQPAVVPRADFASPDPNDPCNHNNRYQGRKPDYEVNDAHVPGRPGFRQNKTPLPNDAQMVYRTAVPGDPMNPTTWWGLNSQGQIYRYSVSGNTAHFSGIDGVGDGTRNLTNYARQRLECLDR
jgi:hypothetical protein